MESDLKALRALLPALPDRGDALRFFDACIAIKNCLYDATASPGELLRLLRELAAEGGAAAALGKCLATGCASGSTANASLEGLGCTARGILAAIKALSARQSAASGALPGDLSPQQLVGLLEWPAAALRSALALAGQGAAAPTNCLAVADNSSLYLHYAADWRVGPEPLARPLEQAKAMLPRLLRDLALLSGRLPLPGQGAAYCAVEWQFMLDTLGCLLSMLGSENASASALAAPAPGGMVGTLLASRLLALLAHLAREWPPPEHSPAVQQEGWPAEVSPAAAAAEMAAGRPADPNLLLVPRLWDVVRRVMASGALQPSLAAVAVRSIGRELLVNMAGMLERLQQRQKEQQGRRQRQEQQQSQEQQQAMGSDEASWSHAAWTAKADLEVLTAAFSAASIILQSHVTACERIMPAPSTPAFQAALNLLAAQRGSALRAAKQVMRMLRHTAGVLPTALAACEAQVQTSAGADLLLCFKHLLHNTAAVPQTIVEGGAALVWRAPFAELLLAAGEAALRCAIELQLILAHQPPAAAQAATLFRGAVVFAYNTQSFCCGYVLDKLESLPAEDIELLLAANAALTSTACKCALLLTAAAQQGGQQALLEESSTESGLLAIAGNCQRLAEIIVETPCGASLRCQLWMQCARLQLAEASARLLPLASPAMRSSFEAKHASIAPLAEQQGEAAAVSVRALAAARRCCHMGCTNIAGASDAALPTKRCSGCRVARFCSAACSAAAWRAGHKQVCRQLAAKAVQADGAQVQAAAGGA